MTKEKFGVLIHDGSGKCIALVRTKIMPVSPTATDELLEVVTGIEFLVIGRQVVQDF